jgi:DNA polymerase-1
VPGDEALLDASTKDADIHTQTARKMLGKEDATKEDRQLAKALNFGLLYGIGTERFRENARAEYGLDLSEGQADRYRDAFFRAYPACGPGTAPSAGPATRR